MTQKISQETIDLMSVPSGWCWHSVLEPQDGLFYQEQKEDMDLPQHIRIFCKRKARRCGWTYSLARESVAECHMYPDTTVSLVSMNLADAFNKIEECRKFYYKIHPDMRRPLIAENRTMLRFSHGPAAYSEVVATFRPRGMSGRNQRIKIDEADHIADLQATFDAAIPNIVQGHSIVKVGGSVYRDHGPFWDLFNLDFGAKFDRKTGELLRKHFMRRELYWWQVPWLVNRETRDRLDAGEREAVVAEALKMDTLERVEYFGSTNLKLTFATMPLDNFQQEMELKAMEEGAALVPWDYILRVSNDPEMEFETDKLKLAQWSSETGAALVAGYDVGRKSNTSELTVFGYFQKTDQAIEKYAETFADVELQVQEDYLRSLLRQFPNMKLSIDAGGLGMQMAETLNREFPARAFAVELEYYQKMGVFDNFARRIIDGRIKLVPDEERRRQINSIKKTTTETGRVTYKVSKKEKHHADKACSQALAIHSIGSLAIGESFELHVGGGAGDNTSMDLGIFAGDHEEFLKDVVNV